jgi:hypothetical protein
VPSHGATNLSLKHKQVKPLSHTPFTQEFKTISSHLFPLKSWPALVPSDQNHIISHRGREHFTLDTLQGSAGPLQRTSPHWLLTLTTPGLPAWSGHLAQISISLHQSKGPVLSSTASSVIWKENPESHQGCSLPGSRDPHRLQSQGAGTRYPTELGNLISLGPPENVERMMGQ